MVSGKKVAKKVAKKRAKAPARKLAAKKAAAGAGPPAAPPPPPAHKRGFLVITQSGQYAVSTPNGRGRLLTKAEADQLKALIDARRAHGDVLAKALNSMLKDQNFDLTDAYIVDHKP